MHREEPAGKGITNSQGDEKEFQFSENLDREHLLMIYEDDIDRAGAIFEIFINGIDKEMEGLRAMETENNVGEFVRKVHKMAPNFAMVGLTDATHELFEIEKEGKASGMTPQLKEKFAKFSNQLEPRIALVKNELRRIKTYLNE